jgi:hypothetical protein
MKSWFRFLSVFLILACGCGEDTSIRSYKVARKIEPASPSAEPQPAQTLGVIVPTRDTAWFLKLMDDPAKVAPLAADFREIAGSLEFDDQGRPRWKLTSGWSEQILESITYAKFSHKDGATATLTKLAANTSEDTEWQKYLLDNVNRWRDQLGLGKQDWQAMQPELEEVPTLSTGTAKAYFVSLEGMRKSGGMGMGGAPFLDRMRAQQEQPNQSDSPQSTNSSPAPRSPDALQLKYQLPSGWTEAASSSGIRLATFEIKDQEQTATVTISTAGGELESTIEMWLNQVEVKPDQQLIKQVTEQATSGKVQDKEFKSYRMQGEGDGAKAIRVAVIPIADNQNMFVKMTGPVALVDANSAAMDQLISSLSW